MSKIQTFANTQNTQFAKLLSKLVTQHVCPHSSLNSIFVHRILYAFYKYNAKPDVTNTTMQAIFVRMLRKNTKTLRNIANTPTAYMPK